MANTSSAQKAMRQAQRRAARNQSARSAVRTYFKKASVAVASSSDDAAAVVVEAVSALDRAAQRGIIHRNAAARRKSRLMARLHQISLAAKAAAETPAKAEDKADQKQDHREVGCDRRQEARRPQTSRQESAQQEGLDLGCGCADTAQRCWLYWAEKTD